MRQTRLQILCPSAVRLWPLLLAAACGPGKTAPLSQTKDLSTGEHANVASPLGGAVVALRDLHALHLLPNTRIPKGVFVTLAPADNGESNAPFIRDLYRLIAGINEQDHLVATADLRQPTVAELSQQAITLVVLVAKGHMADYQALLGQVRQGGSGEAPPYIIPSEVDKEDGDQWTEDFGKFGVAQWQQPGLPKALVVIDTMRNKNRGEYNPTVFMQTFHMPLVQIGLDADISGQYGGNLDATPEGVFYMGNSVDDHSTDHPGPGLFEQMRALGNPSSVKLLSDWLVVGHVDEYLTFTPSRLGCGATAFAASPLQGLQLMVEQATDSEFAMFAKEAADAPVYGEDKNVNTVFAKADLILTRANIAAALQALRRTPGGDLSTTLSDYDLSRIDPAWAQWDKALTLPEFKALATSGDKLVRYYIWRNLMAQAAIETSLTRLAAASTCFQSEVLPQIFRPDFVFSNAGHGSVRHHGDIAHLPGVTNSLVLRDHVITPDPQVAAMRRVVSERIGKHVGDGATHVHFIDDHVYHTDWGEVHCGTNVIREAELDFRFTGAL